MSWRDKIAAVLAGKVGGPTPTGIHVYHSSPHDFDKFDLSKIGTGEGAQVYGHGIYAAENPAVSGQGGQYWGQFLQRFSGPEMRTAEFLKQHGFDRDAAIAELKRQYADPKMQGSRSQIQTKLDLLGDNIAVGPRTYEVNFKAQPEQLLDWDKPLSKQPHVEDFFHDRLLDVMPRKAVRDELDVRQNFTGEKLYRDLTRSMFDRYGHRDAATNARYASETLAEGGIPGIRYLDEGSRNINGRLAAIQNTGDGYHITGKGQFKTFDEAKAALGIEQPTHNYVAFDPSKLDIMAKYGVIGATGGVLGAGAMGGTIDQSTYGDRQ